MQSLPPPGWYPDPWTSGRSWRWWDGQRWTVSDAAYDPRARGHEREEARVAGKWFRAALVAACVVGIFLDGVIVAILSSGHDALFTTTPDGVLHVSDRFARAQLALFPSSFVGFAVAGIEIWWILRIGVFAGRMGWPTARSRVLGAWSLLIPIVSLWFPYQAIRDAYPPGVANGAALRWWLWNVIAAPLLTLVVFTVALFGNGAATAIVL